VGGGGLAHCGRPDPSCSPAPRPFLAPVGLEHCVDEGAAAGESDCAMARAHTANSCKLNRAAVQITARILLGAHMHRP
jgi:hypothetical protein